jgi:tRNA pseudouridine38-40 synthase
MKHDWCSDSFLYALDFDSIASVQAPQIAFDSLRMVAAMVKAGEGKAAVDEVRAALEGRDITFGLAPPEGLTLMDIDYGLAFTVECPPTMSRRAEEYRLDAFTRLSFADSLLQRCRE